MMLFAKKRKIVESVITYIFYILSFSIQPLLAQANSASLPAGEAEVSAGSPIAIYLYWAQRPDSSMVVSWVAPISSDNRQGVQQASSILVKKAADANEESWKLFSASSKSLPEGRAFQIHQVQLEGLAADCLYQFRIGGTSLQHTFRTAPADLVEPVNFVIGGDTYKQDAYFRTTNLEAAATNPLFAVLGGDLAYGTPSNIDEPEDYLRWLNWLKSWYETMQSYDVQEGLPSRLIPMLTAIGNHEVKGRYGQTKAQAPFFYSLFRDPYISKSYYILRFGRYLSLYLLDSGHTEAVGGDQKQWLEEQLSQDILVNHKIACYHVPAYPSVRYYRNEASSQVRRYWPPLFDQYRLHLAFENHDHAYKRTLPLKNHTVHPNGVVYIGDGSWGTEERIPKKAQRTTYLAKTVQARQFCLVSLRPGLRLVRAINRKGVEIDFYQEQTDFLLAAKLASK